MIEEFLQTPAGRAVMGVVIALLAVLIIELNYKLFFKRVLDILFSLIFTIILSPVLAVGAAISKRNAGEVFEINACPGKKGKIIYVHSFAGINGKLKNLPYVFDVFKGSMSFVGTKLLNVSDGAFMDDAAMERFAVRPGIFNHLALGGNDELTYEQMFALDGRYVKKRGFFRDIFTVIVCIVLAIRGDGKSYLGEARDKGYAEILLKRGDITADDIKRAEQSAEKAIAEDGKAKDFKRQKRL